MINDGENRRNNDCHHKESLHHVQSNDKVLDSCTDVIVASCVEDVHSKYNKSDQLHDGTREKEACNGVGTRILFEI